MLAFGAAAPWFRAPTHSHDSFNFGSVGGRYVLMVFAPSDPQGRAAALSLVAGRATIYADHWLAAFVVMRDPAAHAACEESRGLRYVLDADWAVARRYGALQADGAETPGWTLLDPNMRAMASGALGEAARLYAMLDSLPPVDDHAGVTLHAPVLVVPRVFEPEICRRLIAMYQAHGGTPSGVMRDVGGRTVGVMDDTKRRRDMLVEDPDLRAVLRARIERSLIPEIQKAFQFRATRLERYLVACYDAADGGYFRAHRDNTTLGTAHRRFACSINLNAEEFEGGDLRFPEFGRRTYRPPTGGAVIFSCSLLHEATPVTRGLRYAFLPFFYDEAAERVREANAASLAPA